MYLCVLKVEESAQVSHPRRDWTYEDMLEARKHAEPYINMIPLMTGLRQRINLRLLGCFLVICLMLVCRLCLVTEVHLASRNALS